MKSCLIRTFSFFSSPFPLPPSSNSFPPFPPSPFPPPRLRFLLQPPPPSSYSSSFESEGAGLRLDLLELLLQLFLQHLEILLEIRLGPRHGRVRTVRALREIRLGPRHGRVCTVRALYELRLEVLDVRAQAVDGSTDAFLDAGELRGVVLQQPLRLWGWGGERRGEGGG